MLDRCIKKLQWGQMLTIRFGCVLLVICFIISLFASHYSRFPFDLTISEFVQSISLPFFDSLMQSLSAIGNWVPATIMTISLTTGLLLARKMPEAAYILGSVVSSILLNRIIKELVDRPRPDSSLVEVSEQVGGGSFPSGHAAFVTVIFGLLTIYLFTWGPGLVIFRRVVQISLVMLILLMAVSRVYLGVHWASDTIGGIFIALTYMHVISVLKPHFKTLFLKFRSPPEYDY